MLPPSRFVDIPLGGDAVQGGDAVSIPAVSDPEGITSRPSTLLPWTIKLCLALGLLAFGATQYLSRAVESRILGQREARAGVEPETTGSLGGAAARTILDPCTAAGLRR